MTVIAFGAIVITVSGIPPFEMLGRQMWGYLRRYREYASRYPVFIPDLVLDLPV